VAAALACYVGCFGNTNFGVTILAMMYGHLSDLCLFCAIAFNMPVQCLWALLHLVLVVQLVYWQG